MSFIDDIFEEDMNLDDILEDCIEDLTYHIEDVDLDDYTEDTTQSTIINK